MCLRARGLRACDLVPRHRAAGGIQLLPDAVRAPEGAHAGDAGVGVEGHDVDDVQVGRVVLGADGGEHGEGGLAPGDADRSREREPRRAGGDAVELVDRVDAPPQLGADRVLDGPVLGVEGRDAVVVARSNPVTPGDLAHVDHAVQGCTQKSLPEIARELDVDVVVEGTVRRAESRVRITAQLVESARRTVICGLRASSASFGMY